VVGTADRRLRRALAAASVGASIALAAPAGLAQVSAFTLPLPIPTGSPRSLAPDVYAPTRFSPAVAVNIMASGWIGFQPSPSSWRLTRSVQSGANGPAIAFEGMRLPAERALAITRAALGLRGAAPHRVALAGFPGWRVDGTAAETMRRADGGRVLQGDVVRLIALQVSRSALVVVVNSRPGEFRAFMNAATNVLGSLRLGSGYALEFKVYAGYYDTHHAARLKPKPDPWQGSPNVTFAGQPDAPSGGWDTSAVRLDNLSAHPLRNVHVTVDIGTKRYNLWGTYTLAPGQTLVLAQTAYENFDGSDQANSAGCYGCDGELCTTVVSSSIPVVHVTIDGRTADFLDRGQVLNTQGVDSAGCPATGSRRDRNDESQAWQPLG
jgi:hypothetical protein